jgi:amino acid adenylation domain-containing protein
MKINILDYLANTVKNVPNKTAIVENERNISFNELDLMSRTLAVELNKSNYANKPIAVFLPKSIESIIANIGITYSGNAYMNLDIKTPTNRISKILEQIKPAVIITNGKYHEILYAIANDIPLIIFEDISFNGEHNLDTLDQVKKKIIDTDPYCIINTSGSTGTPKGVALNYKSFIDFTEWAVETLKIGDDEIIGSLSPIVFDIYSFELCMLMAKGSTIVLLPESLAAFPIRLLSIMQEKKVSFIFWVPTIMVNIANMDLLSKIKLPDLQTVWFAGEVFPTKQFKYWKKHLNETMFVNLYGPIEITLDCTYYIVEKDLNDNEPIPIGYPCRNTGILILNENDQEVTGDEEGELCVRGTSLAMGYYNNLEKTQAAFVQNPLNKSYPEVIYRTGDIVAKNGFGEIVFKGRKDSLVKHLGYRIELGEIEHVIVNILNIVKNGCVVYQTTRKEITLFYESETEISLADFRKQIASILPKYMIPTVFIRMDEMPRNTNGKIDRLMLKNQIN